MACFSWGAGLQKQTVRIRRISAKITAALFTVDCCTRPIVCRIGGANHIPYWCSYSYAVLVELSACLLVELVACLSVELVAFLLVELVVYLSVERVACLLVDLFACLLVELFACLLVDARVEIGSCIVCRAVDP